MEGRVGGIFKHSLLESHIVSTVANFSSLNVKPKTNISFVYLQK